ncbi:hypothetical protein C8T65DRAFT_164328 [Cerioporus squamosus]|nr:hypothetical protein C8T65DRAFT_164328 [Cerioporus squamosus]
MTLLLVWSTQLLCRPELLKEHADADGNFCCATFLSEYGTLEQPGYRAASSHRYLLRITLERPSNTSVHPHGRTIFCARSSEPVRRTGLQQAVQISLSRLCPSMPSCTCCEPWLRFAVVSSLTELRDEEG